MFFDSICLLQLCRGKPITIKLVHRVWLSCTSCVKEITNHMFRIGGACVYLFLHLQVTFLSLPSQVDLFFFSSICLLQLHRGTTTMVIACAQTVQNLTLDAQDTQRYLDFHTCSLIHRMHTQRCHNRHTPDSRKAFSHISLSASSHCIKASQNQLHEWTDLSSAPSILHICNTPTPSLSGAAHLHFSYQFHPSNHHSLCSAIIKNSICRYILQ